MFARIPPDVLEGLKDISTGTVGHFLSDGFLDWRIQCLFRPVKMVGQAVTVSSPPTDNSVFVDALDRAEPGDVLVIDRRSDRRHASWGGILTLAAQRKGLAGVVIDGAATDWREITDLRFPVFCRHLSALTTRKQDLGGTVGRPVPCGGVTIEPGMVVLGDEDGVVAIRADRAEEVLRRGRDKEDQEARMREALGRGLGLREARAALQNEGG